MAPHTTLSRTPLHSLTVVVGVCVVELADVVVSVILVVVVSVPVLLLDTEGGVDRVGVSSMHGP